MGDENTETFLIPMAARGLKVLLVDENVSSLIYISSVLEQHFYKVRSTELSSVALSIIGEVNDGIDLVIADTNIKEMGVFTFLRHMLLIKDIPIILMSSGENKDVASKALYEGACFVLDKPTSTSDLVNIWQHVYRRRILLELKNQEAEYLVKQLNDICLGPTITLENDKKHKLEQIQITYRTENVKSESKSKAEGEQSIRKRRIRSRMKWTSELHLKFMEAIRAIGEKKARPRALLRLMNEPTLTLRHVASHLQKFRDCVRRINVTQNSLVRRSDIARTFAVGSSVHHKFTNIQEELLVPWNSMRSHTAFYGKKLTSDTGYYSSGINYSSASQLDHLLPSTNHPPEIDTFVGTEGASHESNVVERPHLSWPEIIVENPEVSFSEFLKFTEANEGQRREENNEQEFDDFIEWLNTPHQSHRGIGIITVA